MTCRGLGLPARGQQLTQQACSMKSGCLRIDCCFVSTADLLAPQIICGNIQPVFQQAQRSACTATLRFRLALMTQNAIFTVALSACNLNVSVSGHVYKCLALVLFFIPTKAGTKNNQEDIRNNRSLIWGTCFFSFSLGIN